MIKGSNPEARETEVDNGVRCGVPRAKVFKI